MLLKEVKPLQLALWLMKHRYTIKRTAITWPLAFITTKIITQQHLACKFLPWLQLLSAAEGKRPRNYSSCCCSWIFHLIYALSSSTTVLPPIFLNISNVPTHLPTHPAVFFLSIYQSTSSIPKYQYIIAADPGAGIGPCYKLIHQSGSSKK